MFSNSGIQMKFLILITTVQLLSSLWVDCLVVSKLNMNSFINYYQKEIMEHNVEKIKELFNKKDLFEYCDRLRQARVYEAVNTKEELSQEPYEFFYVFSKETLEFEKNDSQMQLFNFRLGNSKETRTFWGFQCMNYARNMSWIVTPAFVPDSAFLFEFELNFRHLSYRELQRVKEVIARSVAFIDEEGLCTGYSIRKLRIKYAEKTNLRDPLCDLNPVLQYRLCSLALNSFVETLSPLEDLQADNLTSRNYTVQEYRQYFDLNDAKDRCDLITISNRHGPNNGPLYRKMLHCPVNQEKHSEKKLYHIGLHPINSKKLFLTYVVLGPYQSSDFPLQWELLIPLLRHIEVKD